MVSQNEQLERQEAKQNSVAYGSQVEKVFQGEGSDGSVTGD